MKNHTGLKYFSFDWRRFKYFKMVLKGQFPLTLEGREEPSILWGHDSNVSRRKQLKGLRHPDSITHSEQPFPGPR